MVDELALKYCGPNNLMRLDIQQVLLKNFILKQTQNITKDRKKNVS